MGEQLHPFAIYCHVSMPLTPCWVSQSLLIKQVFRNLLILLMKLLKVNAEAAELELIFLYLPGYASDVTK